MLFFPPLGGESGKKRRAVSEQFSTFSEDFAINLSLKDVLIPAPIHHMLPEYTIPSYTLVLNLKKKSLLDDPENFNHPTTELPGTQNLL